MSFLKRLWKRLFGKPQRGRGCLMGNRLSGGRNIGAGV